MGQAIGCSYCNNEPGNIPVQKSDFPFNNYEIIENYRFKSNLKSIQTESFYDKNNTKTLNTDSNINYEKIFDENILKVANVISDNEILILKNKDFKNLEKDFNQDDFTLIDYSNLIKKEIAYKFKMDNSIYKGSWNKNGKKEGFGIYINPSNDIYIGYFLNDLFNGKGKLINSNGDYFEGNFINGKANGNGKLIIKKDNYSYEGQFKNDLPNGFGIYYWNNDTFYEGNWVNNSQHGEGTFSNGLRRIKGIFRFGKLIQCSENKKIRKNNLRITFALPDKNIIQKELNLDNNTVNEILGNDNKSSKNITKIKSSFAEKVQGES